jgi:hypothetical protein
METKKNITHKNIPITSGVLRSLLLEGRNIDRLSVSIDDDIILFKQYQEDLLSEPITFFDDAAEQINSDTLIKSGADEWIFPMEYQTIDVKEWLLGKCNTEQEISRVNEEYVLFEERDLIMALRSFIFLVDYMRKHKHIWGVGRGSAVASFCLYLIGVHKVNPLLYNLPISDYLR